jgi:3-oxoacyl-[acyl-carrier-protein] synthase III
VTKKVCWLRELNKSSNKKRLIRIRKKKIFHQAVRKETASSLKHLLSTKKIKRQDIKK